jgi:CRISPR/Cas system CSM-associated protein Csm3 (group 7 of RAMP superfamily)
MHKQLVNQCSISFSLETKGPLLIKASSQGGDPTKPDMEFVETYCNGRKSIYLPGSSLKGAIRAHAERIVETIGVPTVQVRPQDDNKGAKVYSSLRFIEQMFGSTKISGRMRIDDAYPDPDLNVILEERNSVAIDRVLGSTAGTGLFNYQVCTQGRFITTIHLKNFSLPQLGLIGLVLRDLNQGWFAIGYGKSRGLGVMQVDYQKAVVQYPTCVKAEEQIKRVGQAMAWPHVSLLGAGEFLGKGNVYGFPHPDIQATPVVAHPMALGFGVEMTWRGDEQVRDLFARSVNAWKTYLGVAA